MKGRKREDISPLGRKCWKFFLHFLKKLRIVYSISIFTQKYRLLFFAGRCMLIFRSFFLIKLPWTWNADRSWQTGNPENCSRKCGGSLIPLSLSLSLRFLNMYPPLSDIYKAKLWERQKEEKERPLKTLLLHWSPPPASVSKPMLRGLVNREASRHKSKNCNLAWIVKGQALNDISVGGRPWELASFVMSLTLCKNFVISNNVYG